DVSRSSQSDDRPPRARRGPRAPARLHAEAGWRLDHATPRHRATLDRDAPVSRPRLERNTGQHRRANAVAHDKEAVAAMELGPHRATLARPVVFERLAPRDLELVLDVTQTIDASPGQAILTEGTPGDGVYVVLEGQVEIFLPERSVGGIRRPSRVGLNRLGPG